MAEPDVCAPIDANGNLASDGTKSYHWNALNQLVEVKEGTTTLATFEYDGKGRRTEKAAGGITHTYIYDAEDVVEERISGSSSDTIRYFHGAGIDEPLTRKNSADVVTYYLEDHLGSIAQETNASGAVVLEREYGPWGDLLSGAATAGYAFQGREWDPEIALYYFRARYYNAAAGAWTADDPIGFAGGSNFSRFVNNNPTRFVDPFGLCSTAENGPDSPNPRPRNPDGTIKPPPVPVPHRPDLEWKWNADLKNKRDGTWGPKNWRGPNPPSASWDPETAHWDVNDGTGKRDRYDPNGNPLTPGQAHPGRNQLMDIVGIVGTGYLIYRATRMLPSVAFPPLWPTILPNAVIP